MRLAPNPGSTAPCSEGQYSRDKSWWKRENYFIQELSSLGRWWTNVLRSSPSCQLGDKGFKDSESEGAAGCLLSSCTVLILIGIKVKFPASPVFSFNPVGGLHAYGQQFSSGGVLISAKRGLSQTFISFMELGVE